MKHSFKVGLAVFLALATPQTFGMGLGSISVKSRLDEPLVAEIPLTDVAANEVQGLIVSQASTEESQRVGIDPRRLQTSLDFMVAKRSDGRTFIRVTTREPVHDPLLAFAVKVNSASGRMLRQYTLTLDPRGAVPSGALASTEPAEETERAPAQPIEEQPSRPAAAAPSQPARSQGQPAADQPKAATVKPMVQAPTPKPAAPAPVPAPPPKRAPEAPKAVVEQAKPAAPAPKPVGEQAKPTSEPPKAVVVEPAQPTSKERTPRTTPPPAVPAPAPAVAEKAPAKREATAVEPKPSPLPAPSAAGEKTVALQADLQRTKEQLADKEQEASQLRARVEQLEKSRPDNRKQLDQKNAEIEKVQRELDRLARLQSQQEQEVARSQSAPATMTLPPSEPILPPAQPMVQSTPSAALPPATEEPAVAAAPPPPPPVETPSPPPPTAEQVSAPAGASMPNEAPASPLQDWKVIAGIGLLLLAFGSFALLRSRQRKPAAVPEWGAPAPRVAPTLEPAAPAAAVSAARPAPPAATPRKDDEERTLLGRLAANPTDVDLQLDLLRMYYQRGATTQFEQTANTLYAQLGDRTAPAWQRAAEMGRALLPTNPLFAAPAVFAEETETTPAPQAQFGAPKQEIDLDFDLAPEPPTAPASPDFDFDLPANPPVPLPEPELSLPPKPEPTFDFVAEPAALATPEPRAAQEQTVEMPIPVAPPSPLAVPELPDAENPVDTKLDLALAFIEMDDDEAARNMLEEVLEEGDAKQKSEAQKLLSEIVPRKR